MKRSGYKIYIILFLIIHSFGFSGELPKTKTIIVSGIIADRKTNESLAGVKVVCANCNKTVYSDLDGHFLMYLEINTDEKLEIEFSQIGYAAKNLDLQSLQASSGNFNVELESE